jgi:hypothetical protein
MEQKSFISSFIEKYNLIPFRSSRSSCPSRLKSIFRSPRYFVNRGYREAVRVEWHGYPRPWTALRAATPGHMGGDAHATQPAAFQLRRQSANLVRNWYKAFFVYSVASQLPKRQCNLLGYTYQALLSSDDGMGTISEYDRELLKIDFNREKTRKSAKNTASFASFRDFRG